ncbi:MAG TPA: Yip1 family protein [Thermoanaerobaculia bacterium]|jgi:hypothetical protein|nr:Yip1 family protein [Thermoanaerobaculia bacterium]
MTTGQDNALATPAPDPGPKPNPIQRIIGVLFSPDATFASIAKRPDWVVVLLLIVVLALANGLLTSSRIDFGAPAREAMAQNKNLSQEQIDRAERISVGMGKVAKFIAPVIAVIALLIVAGAILVAVRLAGGEGDFKQAFAVTCYAWIPNLIQGVVLTIIIFAKGATAINPQSLATMVRSSPAFLVDMKSQPMAFALLSSLDLFTIWVVVLLIIGFAYVARVSKAKSGSVVVSLWIVTILLFKLLPAALQALRK